MSKVGASHTHLTGVIDILSCPDRIVQRFQNDFAVINNVLQEAQDSSAIIPHLRGLRDSIIGNKNAKIIAVKAGIIPFLIGYLTNDNHPTVQAIAMTIYGSLAQMLTPEISGQLSEHKIQEKVLSFFFNDNEKVLEASCRTLYFLSFDRNTTEFQKTIYSSPTFPRLVSLIRGTNADKSSPVVVEHLLRLLANTCNTHERQETLSQIIFEYVRLTIPVINIQSLEESALELLASVLHGNKETCCEVLRDIIENSLSIGTQLPKKIKIPRSTIVSEDAKQLRAVMSSLLSVKNPTIRLLVISCFINIHHSISMLPPEINAGAIVIEMERLLAENEPIQIRSAHALAYFVDDDLEMQQITNTSGILASVAALLQPTTSPALQEALLRLVAALCSRFEENRRAFVESSGLGLMVSALSSENQKIRCAACMCVRSLSRSVRSLRTSLLDVDISTQLLFLLNDDNLQVVMAATLSLANMVLDFSPMKKTVIEKNGVQRFVSFIKGANHELRRVAVGAIKNLLHDCSQEMKNSILEEIGASVLSSLVFDESIEIQIEGLAIFRNISYRTAEDVNLMLTFVSMKNLLDLLVARLSPGSEPTMVEALGLLINIANGSVDHRQAICENRLILQSISRCLDSENIDARANAVWIVINLCWIETDGAQERITMLRNLGIENQLMQMKDDDNSDVRDRVLTALASFSSDLYE